MPTNDLGRVVSDSRKRNCYLRMDTGTEVNLTAPSPEDFLIYLKSLIAGKD
jgi:hypothetical protein